MKKLIYQGPYPEHNVLGVYFERGGAAVEVDDQSAEILLKKRWDPNGKPIAENNTGVPEYVDVVDAQVEEEPPAKIAGKKTVKSADAGVVVS